MVSQSFEPRVSAEDVLLNNDAIFKCSVPSFVSDHVSVEAWVDSEGSTFYSNEKYGNLIQKNPLFYNVDIKYVFMGKIFFSPKRLSVQLMSMRSNILERRHIQHVLHLPSDIVII